MLIMLCLVVLAMLTSTASAETVAMSPSGVKLNKLPGHELLNPPVGPNLIGVDLVLTPATLSGPTGAAKPTLTYTAGFYWNSVDSKAHLFAPTMRLKAGLTFYINLKNNLTNPKEPVSNQLPESEAVFEGPTDTNIHTHGLHHFTGAPEQTTDYVGGDAVFYTLPGKNASSDKGKDFIYTATLPEWHMPGLHWFHPHKHGSSGVQTQTANGLIIVEDDASWLPDANGCEAVREALKGADEQILHFEFMLFEPSVAAFPGANAALDDTSYQAYNEYSDPRSELCCGKEGANQPQQPLSGTNSTDDIILLNGGLQPVIEMKGGEYQRWRLAHTGFKRFLDLQILDASNKKPTKDCTYELIAKDGVYLMQIPRPVDHIFLTSGNRAELLIQCSPAAANATYLLASGIAPSPFGANFTSPQLLKQIVATIQVSAKGDTTAATLSAEACTPLRPAYASDLRDESLAKFNASSKVVQQNVAFTFGNQTYGCLVNDKNYTFPDPDPIVFELGKIVEWPNFTYVSEHPLHIHTNPFQLVELPTKFLAPGWEFTSWFKAGDWMDVLYLPMTAGLPDNTAPTAKIRLQPGSYSGYSVMHCHSLQHEDEGCMKVIQYRCPGYTDKQPEVCEDFTFPVPGTYTQFRAPGDNGIAPAPAPVEPTNSPPPSSGAVMWSSMSSMLTFGYLIGGFL